MFQDEKMISRVDANSIKEEKLLCYECNNLNQHRYSESKTFLSIDTSALVLEERWQSVITDNLVGRLRLEIVLAETLVVVETYIF